MIFLPPHSSPAAIGKTLVASGIIFMCKPTKAASFLRHRLKKCAQETIALG
jgi:hypothetical protein